MALNDINPLRDSSAIFGAGIVAGTKPIAQKPVCRQSGFFQGGKNFDSRLDARGGSHGAMAVLWDRIISGGASSNSHPEK
jgi:hypothetical protein